MDVNDELQTLLDSGLKFSLELTGHGVLIWVGDYLLQSAAVATVATVDQAVEWLRDHVTGSGCPQPIG